MQLQVKTDDIVYGAFTLTPTGLVTQGLPKFEEWISCGDFIKKANKSVHFWLGDWLNFGEGAYGEEFSQALDELDYSYNTLQNDKWVAKNIPPASRRRDLTFSHHQEVADLLPEDQKILLDKAEEKKLSTKEFRQLARQYKLKQEVPEAEKKEVPLDFALVQQVIDSSLNTLDALQGLDLDKTNPDARDWLLSHLKTAVGIMASIVEKYGK